MGNLRVMTGHRQMQTLLPKAEVFVLPNANHLLIVMNPRGMAEALAGFFSHHPLGMPV